MNRKNPELHQCLQRFFRDYLSTQRNLWPALQKWREGGEIKFTDVGAKELGKQNAGEGGSRRR